MLSSSKVGDLGVVFYQCFTFHDHVSGIYKSTHFHLRNIGRIRNLLTFDPMSQLIYALITTLQDFVTLFFITFQTMRLRDYKGYKHRQHVCGTTSSPVLRELHWLKIHDRIIFKIVLFTHKAVNYTAPDYSWDLISVNDKSTIVHTLASFDPCLLSIPPVSNYSVLLNQIDGLLYCQVENSTPHYGCFYRI